MCNTIVIHIKLLPSCHYLRHQRTNALPGTIQLCSTNASMRFDEAQNQTDCSSRPGTLFCAHWSVLIHIALEHTTDLGTNPRLAPVDFCKLLQGNLVISISVSFLHHFPQLTQGNHRAAPYTRQSQSGTVRHRARYSKHARRDTVKQDTVNQNTVKQDTVHKALLVRHSEQDVSNTSHGASMIPTLCSPAFNSSLSMVPAQSVSTHLLCRSN